MHELWNGGDQKRQQGESLRFTLLGSSSKGLECVSSEAEHGCWRERQGKGPTDHQNVTVTGGEHLRGNTPSGEGIPADWGTWEASGKLP